MGSNWELLVAWGKGGSVVRERNRSVEERWLQILPEWAEWEMGRKWSKKGDGSVCPHGTELAGTWRLAAENHKPSPGLWGTPESMSSGSRQQERMSVWMCMYVCVCDLCSCGYIWVWLGMSVHVCERKCECMLVFVYVYTWECRNVNVWVLSVWVCMFRWESMHVHVWVGLGVYICMCVK